MEQSIKRVEDLPGETIKSAFSSADGCIVVGLDSGKHAVFGATPDIEHDMRVFLAEPDVCQLSRYKLITIEQLEYEIRDEVTGRNWPRVRELTKAVEILEEGRCEVCGTETIDNCLRCGAPQCCPKCCQETANDLAREVAQASAEKLDREIMDPSNTDHANMRAGGVR